MEAFMATRRTFLSEFSSIPVKVAIVALALASRLIGIYAVLASLLLNVSLLTYVGFWRTPLRVALAWLFTSTLLIAINAALKTLTVEHIYNLIYGYTTFTALYLILITTPPQHVRELLGFNVLSLAYLLLNYSIKLISEALDTLRSRGWTPTLSPIGIKYALRAFATLLVVRVEEVEEALRARGVE
jgi:energy-coupling factor transport system permease protein